MTGDTPRSRDDDARETSLEALLAGPVEVPSDASALDDLPPYGAPAPGPRPHLDMSQDPDRYDPVRDAAGPPAPAPSAPTGPLDMSQDPDRYDAARDTGYDAPTPGPVGPLDMSRDPDRFDAGSGQTLSDLLGPGAGQEDERDSFTWLVGLFAVAAFLGLVALFFSSVEPG